MMMMMMIYDSEKGDVWLLNCAVASPGVATTSNQAEYTMERRRGSLQRLRKWPVHKVHCVNAIDVMATSVDTSEWYTR